MFIIEPITAIKIILMVLQKIADEEERKKMFNILIFFITAFTLVLTLVTHLLTSPIEALAMMFSESPTEYAVVENFHNEYGYYGDDGINIDVTGDYVENEIPLFIQWDKRWSMYSYGNSTIGQGGCGTTSMAMVVVGLTGDTTVNPKTMADYSMNNGYRVNGVGTAWGLFTVGAKDFGLNGIQIARNAESISQALREGKPIIASMDKGTFTNGGHIIVLKGITENGKILVNDPNSYKLSDTEWNVALLIRESKAMWAFELAE